MRAMYRDDTCATCGQSLPPDHLYCREHAAEVDARLHELGARLPRLLDDLDAVARLLGELAEETYDYVAEAEPDEPAWPPRPDVTVRADAEDVDVDVDPEPGYVDTRLTVELPTLLAALREGLPAEELRRFAGRCADAQGAGATHPV